MLRRPRPLPRLRLLRPRLRLRQPPRRRGGGAGDGVGGAVRRGSGHGEGAGVPAQGVPAADHPPGHQGLQRAAHRRLPAPDLRLRAGQVAADGVDSPGDRADRGHLRVPGARVLHARHRGREDGRVRLRRLPAGGHGRPQAGGRHPQEPPQLGAAPAERGQDGGAGGSEDHRRRRRHRRLRRRAGAPAGVRGVALHPRVGDVEAVDDRGPGAAGGRGGHQGGAVGDAGAGGRRRRGGGDVGLRRPRRRR